MNILWCGGEDIDFANAPSGMAVTTTSTNQFRSAWVRCAVQAGSTNVVAYTNPFPAGAVTSCWLSVQLSNASYNTGGTADGLMIGLILGSTGKKGIWLGNGSDYHSLAVYTYDGTTKTRLCQFNNAYPAGTTSLLRVDLQVVSYGSGSTINLYAGGVLVGTYSGSTAIAGVANLDSVGLNFPGSGSNSVYVSEIIVADSDTRGIFGLQTLALTGAGTTDAWTGTYSNINGTAYSDASPAYTNTTGQDEQFNVSDVTAATTYDVLAVKVAARAASPAGSTATQIKLGYNSGGTVAFGSGATKTIAVAFGTVEQLDKINPVTSAPFASTDMNALQLEFQSA